MAKSRQVEKKEHLVTSAIEDMCITPLHPLYWIIPPVILSVIAFCFYYPSRTYNFQFDDIANISKFYNIRHTTFAQQFMSNTRWISYWLNSINYRIAKFDPSFYRTGNICFHICTGVLLFFLILTLLSYLKRKSFFTQHRFQIAYLSALFFLLHPVQTQTVSYVIQGQLEGLACFFIVSMCFSFIQFIKSNNNALKLFWISSLFFLGFIGCGTKEIAIMSPFFIMLIDWFFVAQADMQNFKKRIALHGSLLLLVLGVYLYLLKPLFFKKIFFLELQAQNNIGNVLTENPSDSISPLHFFISQFKVVIHYIFMFIWPFNISVEYDWKLVHGFFSFDCIMPFLLLICLVGTIFYALKKDKGSLYAFAWLWFLVAIAPRSSIIPSSELLADYKTYVASIGIFCIISCLLIKLSQIIFQFLKNDIALFKTTHFANILITLLMFPMGFATYTRNKVWRSGEEFWTNIIQNAPGKARAYNNLGVALSEQGKMKESIPLYKKAIAMDRFYPDPWNNLAVAYSMTNKMDLAIDTLRKALKIHRNYPEGYNNLASFLIAKKEYELAEKMVQCAIALRPHYGKAYFNYAKLHLERGDQQKAFQAFKDACTKADLDNAAGFTAYANISIALEKYDDAIFAFSKLIELNPNCLDYVLNLANAYLLSNKPSNALDLYKKITYKNAHDMRAWYNMGECYLKLSQPEKAFECFSIVKQGKLPILSIDLRRAICMYQMGKKNQARDMVKDVLVNQADKPQVKQAAIETLAMMHG